MDRVLTITAVKLNVFVFTLKHIFDLSEICDPQCALLTKGLPFLVSVHPCV